MRIEDCKVGMKVEPLKEFGKIHKDGLKIHSINPGRKLISIRNGCFISSDHKPEYFRPASKFKIKEKVIYKSFDSQTIKKREEAVIFGIAPEKDKLKREYAISYIHEGPYGEKKRVNKMVAEHKLSQLKKPDELEVGDKFKVKSGTVYKILSVGYDDFYNDVDYYIKAIKGNRAGRTDTILSKHIAEIIYD